MKIYFVTALFLITALYSKIIPNEFDGYIKDAKEINGNLFFTDNNYSGIYLLKENGKRFVKIISSVNSGKKFCVSQDGLKVGFVQYGDNNQLYPSVYDVKSGKIKKFNFGYEKVEPLGFYNGKFIYTDVKNLYLDENVEFEFSNNPQTFTVNNEKIYFGSKDFLFSYNLSSKRITKILKISNIAKITVSTEGSYLVILDENNNHYLFSILNKSYEKIAFDFDRFDFISDNKILVLDKSKSYIYDLKSKKMLNIKLDLIDLENDTITTIFSNREGLIISLVNQNNISYIYQANLFENSLNLKNKLFSNDGYMRINYYEVLGNKLYKKYRKDVYDKYFEFYGKDYQKEISQKNVKYKNENKDDNNHLGVWLWKIGQTGYSHTQLAQKLKDMGVRRVYLKVYDLKANPHYYSDFGSATANTYKALGLEVLGWSYNYPESYNEQADVLYQVAKEGYEGDVIDVEAEFESNSSGDEEEALCTAFNTKKIVAISDGYADENFSFGETTFGRIIYHSNIRIDVMDQYVDYHMPQTYFEYWSSSYSPTWYASKVKEEFIAYPTTKPIYQIVSMEKSDGSASHEKINEFYTESGNYSSLWRIPGGGVSTSNWAEWEQINWDMFDNNGIETDYLATQIKGENEEVSVYSSTSQSSSVIATVKSGEYYAIRSYFDGWYEIYIPSGTGNYEGWIYSGLDFETGTLKGAQESDLIEVTTDELNVRSQPSTAGDVITTISSGQKFIVLANEGNWYKFNIGNINSNTYGWASKGSSGGYLSIVSGGCKKPYGAEVISLNYADTLGYGNTEQVNLKIKNIGISSYDSQTILTTSNPHSASSLFYNENWISLSEVMAMPEILPGQEYEATFNITAQDYKMNATDYFNFNQKDFSWFSETGNLGPADDEIKISVELVTAKINNQDLSKDFILYNNYPNPFNPTTTIKYSLGKDTKVNLKVFDISGQLVYFKMINGFVGLNYEKFNANFLASGTYYYQLQIPGKKLTGKMLLIK